MKHSNEPSSAADLAERLKRRDFLLRASAAVSVVAAGGSIARQRWLESHPPVRWTPQAVRQSTQSRVAIVRQSSYDVTRLETEVQRTLALFDLSVAGKRIALKPNFVEYDPHGVINTSPALVGVVAQAFRRLGAASVVIAEGPGHRRDNAYLLGASGLLDMMRDLKVPYVDLNTDDAVQVAARANYSGLRQLWLPRTIVEADLVVSMPKLKTHHWAGVTLSMKNLFGIMPGAIYGWPKNVLHQHGIEESILDISATLSKPPFTIVDGIVGMEGNGPIQGTAVNSGVLIFGDDPVSVDATAARLMEIDPTKVRYLREAGRFLGNISDARVAQIGEPIRGNSRPFVLMSRAADLRQTGG